MNKVVRLSVLLALAGASSVVFARPVKFRAQNGTQKAQQNALSPSLTQAQKKIVSRGALKSSSSVNLYKEEPMTEDERISWKEDVNYLLDLREKRISGKITPKQFDDMRQTYLKDKADKREEERKERFRRLRGGNKKK